MSYFPKLVPSSSELSTGRNHLMSNYPHHRRLLTLQYHTSHLSAEAEQRAITPRMPPNSGWMRNTVALRVCLLLKRLLALRRIRIRINRPRNWRQYPTETARIVRHIQQQRSNDPFARSSGSRFVRSRRVSRHSVLCAAGRYAGSGFHVSRRLCKKALSVCDGCVLIETCPAACTSWSHRQLTIHKR